MVQKLREQKGWTQEHLAHASGMSLRTIQRLEAGKSVSKETIINVAAALDVAMEEIRDLYSLKKFHFVVISLSGILLAILATSWFFYTREFSVQTQYLLNYRTFLAITSLLTGIIWGSGCAWLIRIQGPWRGVATWMAGLLIIFCLYNLLPFVKWPTDQYSAAFQWIITGLGSATFSLVFTTWLLGDLKEALKRLISDANVPRPKLN